MLHAASGSWWPAVPTDDAANANASMAATAGVVDAPLHGTSLLPLVRLAARERPAASPPPPLPLLTPGPGGRAGLAVCEAGQSRSLVSGGWRYVYSPAAERRVRKLAAADGASTRHPAAASVEQLYDLAADPNEAAELITLHGLLLPVAASAATPLSARAAVAAAAFAKLRGAMQRDLMNVSASCGV